MSLFPLEDRFGEQHTGVAYLGKGAEEDEPRCVLNCSVLVKETDSECLRLAGRGGKTSSCSKYDNGSGFS